jgi:olefin beta-lactone synthetase
VNSHSISPPIDRPAREQSQAAVCNIAQRLTVSAGQFPFQRAVVFPSGRDSAGRVLYAQLTFAQLDQECDRLARGLREMGVRPGCRLVLMVRPSLEFIALTFALFKVGATVVLIDPGMGRSNIFRCLAEVEPEGFAAIPIVHAIRKLSWGRFPQARYNVTVGRRWFWGGPTYADLLGPAWTPFEIAPTRASDPAAIIFTSGSTGPPKGVLYEHGMFDAQVDLLRDFFDIQPGEVDLPGFPLFALFNAAMGVTTVIPDMDPTRPAEVDPEKIIEAVRDQGVTQAFGSPAIWNRVGRYCEQHGIEFPSLRRVLSAGAPVPVPVIGRMTRTLTAADADIHTPYGATESLPIASISGREVLERTADKTRSGAGTCVGRPFPRIALKIIEISDEPIATLGDARELPAGEIGEIIVSGPATTREYFRKPEATAAAKISDGDRFWHRMGDVGYLDEDGALWFCGRKAHIVETEHGRLFTIRCEAIFNDHPRVYRCALVGVGERPRQRPVIVIEPEAGQFPSGPADEQTFRQELRERAAANELTEQIDTFLFHRSLPVDIRHNIKIFREKLAPWAAERLKV